MFLYIKDIINKLNTKKKRFILFLFRLTILYRRAYVKIPLVKIQQS